MRRAKRPCFFWNADLMKIVQASVQVIYSAVHSRCGHRIARTHPSIFSRADLRSLYADMAIKGKLQTIELYCHHCAESIEPTHIEITEDGKIIVREMEIEKFITAGGGVIPG